VIRDKAAKFRSFAVEGVAKLSCPEADACTREAASVGGLPQLTFAISSDWAYPHPITDRGPASGVGG
jgi:hypothetical protein